jgi:hypothetical protein
MKKSTKPPVLTETLSVRLPRAEFRALVERARQEWRTLSNLVRLMLRQQQPG